jgi:8-oxo-dGTP diphosphatase
MVDYSNYLSVAVGVVFNRFGEVLIAKRHAHKHQGDTWEFPGGKVEAQESVAHALKRELLEEVGLTIIKHEPWFKIPYQYPDKNVLLHVHQIFQFLGTPQGLEGQCVQWIKPQALLNLPFPQANHPIVQRLVTK